MCVCVCVCVCDCMQLLHPRYMTQIHTKDVNQFDFGIDHLVMSMCKVLTCVVEKEYLL